MVSASCSCARFAIRFLLSVSIYGTELHTVVVGDGDDSGWQAGLSIIAGWEYQGLGLLDIPSRLAGRFQGPPSRLLLRARRLLHFLAYPFPALGRRAELFLRRHDGGVCLPPRPQHRFGLGRLARGLVDLPLPDNDHLVGPDDQGALRHPARSAGSLRLHPAQDLEIRAQTYPALRCLRDHPGHDAVLRRVSHGPGDPDHPRIAASPQAEVLNGGGDRRGGHRPPCTLFGWSSEQRHGSCRGI